MSGLERRVEDGGRFATLMGWGGNIFSSIVSE